MESSAGSIAPAWPAALGDGHSPPLIDSLRPCGPPTTFTMRPAYLRTLLPVSRYLLPVDSSNVNAPEAPGASLTQPTSSTGLREIPELVGGVCAAPTATGTIQDRSATADIFTMSPPRGATRTDTVLQQCGDGERRAVRPALRDLGLDVARDQNRLRRARPVQCRGAAIYRGRCRAGPHRPRPQGAMAAHAR